MRRFLPDESGNASVEYVIALTVILVIVLALGALTRQSARAGTTTDTFGLAQHFRRAPYTPQGGVMWAQDVLAH
ncbi:MAG: hypothetical protein LBS17_03275 [Actinomycetes bacterium]|jgi:Flp pilus assembly pilin Flp|nr:hypothetical protein [Actinomycetes bacterium]